MSRVNIKAYCDGCGKWFTDLDPPIRVPDFYVWLCHECDDELMKIIGKSFGDVATEETAHLAGYVR